MNDYEKIKYLVGKGLVPEASEILFERVKNNKELETILLVNSGNFHQTIKARLAGTIEIGYADINFKNFGYVILELNELINQKIEKDYGINKPIKNSQDQLYQITINILLALGVLILLSIIIAIIWTIGVGFIFLAKIFVILLIIAIILKNMEENI